MKRLVCEMCGSNELLKQDDRYICQACGTNYTTEEAKKLLIEVSGSVDVSGSTVKVDNTSFVQKSLENARRAKAKEDWEECEKYYNLVEQHDPKNIEAIFYSAYAKARESLTDEDRFKREQKFKILENSTSIIDDNYDPDAYDANKDIIEQISRDIISLCSSSFVYHTKQLQYGIVDRSESAYTYLMFFRVHTCFVDSLTNIIKIVGEDSRDSLYLYHLICNHYQFILTSGHMDAATGQSIQKKLSETNGKIREISPSEAIPETELTTYQKPYDPNAAILGTWLKIFLGVIIVGCIILGIVAIALQ